ncbi:MAG: hypothetical protein IT204_12230 [Fimbriimonadaceae bacterium]|nr:hypothetical protein [Fimbriimonadaceae bacterium]
MKALRRHPVIAQIGRWWYLWPALWLAVWGAGGPLWRDSATDLALSLGAAATTTLIAVGCHDQAQRVRLARERRRAQWRFLCPHCFCFGPFRYACGDCHRPLEDLVLRTAGQYIDTCSHCQARLFETPAAPRIEARCVACGETTSLEPSHRTAVVVEGALSESAWRQWRREAVLAEVQLKGLSWLLAGTKEGLRAAVRLTASMEAVPPLPANHAFWQLETLATGPQPESEFEVPATVDALRRLLRRWGQRPEWLRGRIVRLEAPVTAAVRERLRQEFHRVLEPPNG